MRAMDELTLPDGADLATTDDGGRVGGVRGDGAGRSRRTSAGRDRAADIIGDWQKPSFDVAASTMGVFDGDRLVAYAEVNRSGRGDAAVDPAYRRRGIGTTLAAWMPARTACSAAP